MPVSVPTEFERPCLWNLEKRRFVPQGLLERLIERLQSPVCEDLDEVGGSSVSLCHSMLCYAAGG